jgi:hypothetical protein
MVKCPKFEGHLVATHTTYAAQCMCWSKIPCRWIKKKIVRICVSIYTYIYTVIYIYSKYIYYSYSILVYDVTLLEGSILYPFSCT